MEDFRDTVRFLTYASHLRQVHPQIHILSPLPETPLTDQFWDQIYFDENGIDDAESGMMQDCEDRRLIAEHKDIFSNFYAFPCPIDRHYLRRAAGFFTYGWLKCSGLMQALHQRAGDMLKIFDLWDRSHRDKNPAYFETWEFATDLVDFAEREFGSEEDPALLVTTRFYRAFRESFDAVRPTLLPDAEQRLTLSPGVILVTVRGDIVRVLGDLQKQRKSSPECVDRIATVVVRSRSEAECRISELPAISSVVLSHAQRGATISDIVAEFHRREIRFGPLTPSEVARHAINKLEADCLICRIPAAQVAEATLATQ
jgi:hypothetical protein